MRLIPVLYYGFTAMDRRFSIPMLPWIVSEIRKRDTFEKLSLGIEDGLLQAYNSDFEIQFSHKLNRMTRFSQADLDPCTFLYLLRDENGELLFCYLFQASKCSDVLDLYQQMKDNNSNPVPSRSTSTASNLTSLCMDISPSSSNFFEVLYIGKIKLWNRKVPNSFIDEALEKFKAHDLEKARKKLEKLKSESSLRRGSVGVQPLERTVPKPHLQRSHSVISDLTLKSPDVEKNNNFQDDEDDRKALCLVETDSYNRTMVLQIDRTDLRLISPDRKVILLQKHHRDVTACVQGAKSSEHFGFVSKEAGSANTFIGYVFKCESQSVASEAVGVITQSFNNAETKSKSTVTSCDHCPMVWFHKLCCEVENLSDKKTQGIIIRRIEQLDEDEQTVILTKYRGVETDSIRDQNELLMMLLRAHCEMKQGRHVHDTAENRSEFLNQYLGGGNAIFRKAKKSLTTSFDNLLKRRTSKDDFNIGIRDMSLPVGSMLKENDNSDKENVKPPVDSMEANPTPNGTPDKNGNISDKNLKSPMMDIFLKVGSPKSNEEVSPNKHEVGSYRQAIFKRVVTPNKPQRVQQKRNRDELRTLWKNSIHQAVLLIRMEKENAKLKARQEETAVKRIKLEYDELVTSPEEEIFERLLTNNENIADSELIEAVKKGVPKAKRGEVWNYLSEQFEKNSSTIDARNFPNFCVPYEDLLKRLTSHQHAILIDLGRTYPSHPYYRSPLGPGQLALFNLLKAYSLLDPEVGYCQGLSFVAGVLLLHMEEPQAFALLRHLMFHRDLRKQYLPNMIGLQVRLYQLSRLLHDRLPSLYEHFDQYEIAPTLYAAPWLLTMFASQFPLGSVARIFDLMFLEDTEVVFRVALALLTRYKDELLAREGFEEIMGFLKSKLPGLEGEVLSEIIEEAYKMDVSRHLNEYQMEYQILQEEMQSVQPLEVLNKALSEENKMLASRVEALNANVQRLEQNEVIQRTQIDQLKAQRRGFEVLVAFVGNLVDVEIPPDVRRILPRKPLVKSLSVGRMGEGPTKTNSLFNQILQRQRTVSETEEEKSPSPTSSIDSGVETPGSPPEEENHPLSSCDVHFTYGGTRELKRLGRFGSVDISK